MPPSSGTLGAVRELIDAGLGLDYDELRLDRTTEAWTAAGASLRERIAA